MSKQKGDKRKRRKKEAAKQTNRRNEIVRQREQRANALAKWKPDIKWRTNGANPEFVQLVQRKFEEIDWNDESVFHPGMQTAFELLKFKGRTAVKQAFMPDEESRYNGRVFFGVFEMAIGNVIFSQMSDDEIKRFIPFNDISIVCSGTRLIGTFESLEVCKKDDQPIVHKGELCFHSKLSPKIKLDGQEKIVAFSKHAIEAVCERACPNWGTYGGLGDAFAFFAKCQFFELTKIRTQGSSERTQDAFVLYQECFLEAHNPAVWNLCNQYYVQIMDSFDFLLPEKAKEKWGFRIGYCPIMIRGDYAIAKTLLAPGYGATPEFALIDKSGLDDDSKRQLKRQARDHCHKKMSKTWDFELLKWFHQNGVEQVRLLPDNAFAPSHEVYFG